MYVFKTPLSNLRKLIPVISESSKNDLISSTGRPESALRVDARCAASLAGLQCFGLVESSTSERWGKGRPGRRVSDHRRLVLVLPVREGLEDWKKSSSSSSSSSSDGGTGRGLGSSSGVRLLLYRCLEPLPGGVGLVGEGDGDAGT